MTTALIDHRPTMAWPAGDTVILRGRVVRPDTRPGRLSTFAATRWELRPAHPDAHAPACTISWSRFPDRLVVPFKTFALAALDHPRAFDRDGGQQHGQHAAVTTIRTWLYDLSVFAHWMHACQIDQVSHVTERDLASYLAHVQALPRTAIRKRDLLHAVRMLWAYRDHLPPAAQLRGDYPWGPESSSALAEAPGPGRYNKTPRIAAATMEALLAWALRMLEDIGPDIRHAWTELRLLRSGTHPSQRHYDRLSLPERLNLFRTTAGATLPAAARAGAVKVNWSHLATLVGVDPTAIRNPTLRAAIQRWGLPVAVPTVGAIAGTISSRPWRDGPIRIDELGELTRHLTTACFVIISYLSGMRPGEVLNLRRSCTDTHPATGELLVHSSRGKGFDRGPLPTDDSDTNARPWVVVQPVHDAIITLETLGQNEFLFPASLLRTGNRRTACTETTRNATRIAADLNAFVTWVNGHFTNADGRSAIPVDPTKHLHASRFRRTLAYFVVRRPRGLIACALQYGHVSTKVTLSYAGVADTSWMDEVAVERLDMILDNVNEDHERLRSGEHVSGPAAAEYHIRLAGAAPFAGRAVTSLRNAGRLLASEDPNVHHGQGMTCVYRAEQAECRKTRLAQGQTADGPDDAECRSTCQNLAYTDRDVDHLRDRLAILTAAAADRLAPRPLRDRAAEQASGIRAVIDRHEAARPARDLTSTNARDAL